MTAITMAAHTVALPSKTTRFPASRISNALGREGGLGERKADGGAGWVSGPGVALGPCGLEGRASGTRTVGSRVGAGFRLDVVELTMEGRPVRHIWACG